MGNEFVGDYALQGVRVRPATVEEALELFPGYWDGLLIVWAEDDKLLMASDGSLMVTDVVSLRRAQETLNEYTYAWEDLMEIIVENSMQSEEYNVRTGVALLAAGWKPPKKG